MMLASRHSSLPIWDKDLRGIEISEYRLRDTFYAVACVLNLKGAADDVDVFSSLNQQRGDYYHQLKINDVDLPTYGVQQMFRKYLKLALKPN